MIISLKKTIPIGDMGIIHLMHWTPEFGESEDLRRYFSVYYSNKFLESSKEFVAEVDLDGIVKKDSATYIVLTDYIKDQLAGKSHDNSEKFEQHLFIESEDAIFDVFKKLYAEKLFKE